MPEYNVVACTDANTVVSSYQPLPRSDSTYENEAEMEKRLIQQLQSEGYEYLDIHSEDELKQNLRSQLEKLNNITFSNDEWKQLYNGVIANAKNGLVEKTRLIQQNYIQSIHRDDGTTKNILLFDHKTPINNKLQVIHQFVIGADEGARHDNRYDVTILVNGFPMVHIELKRRGVPIRQAFNQIDRYQRDSFWAGDGLFQYVQIFIISNGTSTKYYSNTTWDGAIRENSLGKGSHVKTSNSFAFTMYWADGKNNRIEDINDFTRTFLCRHTLLNILAKYCILDTRNVLLVMRPYQIYATERILERINIAHNERTYGTIKAGGYIWHATGSGKTLTSFKTAQLARSLDFIDKILFVVDRKDLDYQTMKEYDRFEKGAANGSSNTSILTRQLSANGADNKVLVTTIQKLSIFIKRNQQHPIYGKEVVFIFDECHRSQFGDMHTSIVKHFKKYYLFGFTGTPIRRADVCTSRNIKGLTTSGIFGDKLHAYTIVDAIRDKNVLPFRVDYAKTFRPKDNISDTKVSSIDRNEVYLSPERIHNNVEYLLNNFAKVTHRSSSKAYKDQSGNWQVGFNSILATRSIEAAKKYYTELKEQINNLPPAKQLKIAIIYSYSANEDIDSAEGFLAEENSENARGLDASSRDFLDKAIDDYNSQFQTNFSTDGNSFQDYYKDVSRRMKNKELDLLIVVDMFLTGFDAPTLNTLWVDKNLRMHGLIQAFSRTNRILNNVKAYGNIVCFENLEANVNEAVQAYGDSTEDSLILVRTFREYYDGYEENGQQHEGYRQIVAELQSRYPLDGKEFSELGEEEQKDFIRLFGRYLRQRNILSSFTAFNESTKLLSDRDFQDYTGHYQDLADEWKRKQESADTASIADDIVFETELVKSVDVGIDYILNLINEYRRNGAQDREMLENIRKAANSSTRLRSKLDLIEEFAREANPSDDIYTDWSKYIDKKRETELNDIIASEHLKPEQTRRFIERSLDSGEVQTTGSNITELMPPTSFFGTDTNGRTHEQRRLHVVKLLQKFVERFFDVGASRFKA